MTLGRAHQAQFFPSLHSGRPIFILVLGSDARPGEPVARERSDVIHIIGVNSQQRRATILDFPRDSWVDIPGHGTGKITSAMALGGPSLTVQTLERLTGLHLSYYLLTSFSGFRAMVDGIGGIRVRVPYLIHDSTAGPGGGNIPAGLQRLNGKLALAFSRARHNVPGGDFGRTENQGRLMLAGLEQLRTQFDVDPGILLAWLGVALRNVRTDLSVEETVNLAFTALRIPPDRVTNIVVPGSAGMAGDASVVFLSPTAKNLFADMRDDGVVTRPPG
jgi:LCP family protein required for cell wall assembly